MTKIDTRPYTDDVPTGGIPKNSPNPAPTPGRAPRPEGRRKMYDFGDHDASMYGDGKGFGLADVRHMRAQGASEENIGKFARDYQASGGKVGKRAAGIYDMKDSEAGALAGSDAQKFLGDWWNKREGGKAKEIKYDYGSHDASKHGGRGIGIRDLEHMRNSGASNENMKKYIRSYRSKGGVVGEKAASFAGIAPWAPKGVKGPNSISATSGPRNLLNSNKDFNANVTNATINAGLSGNKPAGLGLVKRFAGDFMDKTSGSDTAQQYIAASRANPVIDRAALDQRVHERPLYHGAHSDISRTETFGDQWTGRQPPEFVWPDPLKPVEAPDLDYDKFMDKIDSIG